MSFCQETIRRRRAPDRKTNALTTSPWCFRNEEYRDHGESFNSLNKVDTDFDKTVGSMMY